MLFTIYSRGMCGVFCPGIYRCSNALMGEFDAGSHAVYSLWRDKRACLAEYKSAIMSEKIHVLAG